MTIILYSPALIDPMFFEVHGSIDLSLQLCVCAGRFEFSMSHLISLNYEFSYSLLVQEKFSEIALLDFDAVEVAENYLKSDLFDRVI